MAQTHMDDTRISCGCCRGPVEDRCCCWVHQDTPRGMPPKVCSRHRLTCGTCGKAHDTSACPYRFGPPDGTVIPGAPDGV